MPKTDKDVHQELTRKRQREEVEETAPAKLSFLSVVDFVDTAVQDFKIFVDAADPVAEERRVYSLNRTVLDVSKGLGSLEHLVELMYHSDHQYDHDHNVDQYVLDNRVVGLCCTLDDVNAFAILRVWKARSTKDEMREQFTKFYPSWSSNTVLETWRYEFTISPLKD